MERNIKKLNDREYVILRPELFIGSTELTEEEIYIFDFENSEFKKEMVKYVPALIKIVNEFIDNSVDEAIRTNFKYSNRIKIEVNEDNFKVIDNGRGIPVKKNEDGEYFPKVAWGYLRSSSNFDNDSERETIGKFGVGSSVSVICSKYFKGISCDGENKITCEWRNNVDPNTYKEKVTKIKKNGVEVYVEPDFKLFDCEKFTETDIKIIKTRLAMLKTTYPEIKFYLNGEEIKIKDFKF